VDEDEDPSPLEDIFARTQTTLGGTRSPAAFTFEQEQGGGGDEAKPPMKSPRSPSHKHSVRDPTRQRVRRVPRCHFPYRGGGGG
jgi:hypothetical protein